jgi:hypothetical protein
MSNEHWTADQAFAEMKKYKYGSDFLHPEFKRFVYAYEPAGPAPAEAAVSLSSAPAAATATVR